MPKGTPVQVMNCAPRRYYGGACLKKWLFVAAIRDDQDHMTDTERRTECNACRQGVKQLFPFSMAFQPIVDTEARQVFAYEALVRGVNAESAYSILSQVTPENRYAFDQNCRVAAITLASKLGLAATEARLSINFMPGAVYSPAACIQLTLKTAKLVGFPLDRLIF
jgi:EAL domain-containing protein (putative c-di-GMP-specific phosphodiesterase class I)